MVSKNQRKQIQQLNQKKYRQLLGKFVAEGEKVVNEILNAGWKFDFLLAQNPELYQQALPVDALTMRQLTHFSTPSSVLGVFEIPTPSEFQKEPVIIALEGIRDPGNLGTIIRMCDWFGIEQVICSSDTVDCFNAKVVQATMGSIVRVKCHYVEDFETFIKTLQLPIVGADTNGASLYKEGLPQSGVFVFGNESHGISKKTIAVLDQKLAIPNFSKGEKAESLNVAMATSIFLSEIFRSK